MISARVRCSVAAGALVAGCLSCQAPEPAGPVHQFSGPIMGTRYTVKVAAKDPSAERRNQLELTVQRALDAVDSRMSHYLDSSELSQLNRWQGTEPLAVSSEMMEVLEQAREVSAATGGAFDITVGPLVDAWGFGPSERSPEPPESGEIERLLELTGWELLELEPADSTVRKARPGLRLDLSAIAKGYGVDQAVEALTDLGVESFMVEIGGEVRTRGRNPEGRPWRIGIERPVPGERTIDLVLPLADLALATSGDYRNYYEVDGRRVSHTIDPRTGHPITHAVASVSVVDDLCVRADAWATALLVLGPEGFELAQQQGLAAYFLERARGDVFVGRMTEAFAELLLEP